VLSFYEVLQVSSFWLPVRRLRMPFIIKTLQDFPISQYFFIMFFHRTVYGAIVAIMEMKHFADKILCGHGIDYHAYRNSKLLTTSTPANCVVC
jgi:hypothetical protein